MKLGVMLERDETGMVVAECPAIQRPPARGSDRSGARGSARPVGWRALRGGSPDLARRKRQALRHLPLSHDRFQLVQRSPARHSRRVRAFVRVQLGHLLVAQSQVHARVDQPSITLVEP